MANVPEDTPSNVSTMCSWQFEGQCSMARVHDRDDAGSAPSSASLAWPLNDTVCPTVYVPLPVGVSMTGTGSALPTLIEVTAVSTPPRPSSTFRRTVWPPGVPKDVVAVTPVASPYCP